MASKNKLFLLSLIFTILLTSLGISAEETNFAPPVFSYEKAVVLKVSEGNDDLLDSKSVLVKVKSGKYKNKIVKIQHMESSGIMGAKMTLQPKDKVILYVEENPTKAESPNGEPLFNIADYDRSDTLFILMFSFCALLLIIGGKKGFKSLISLLLTIGLIFFVVIPLSVRGFNPVITSTVTSGAIVLIVFRLVSGKTIKSVSAALGTIIGIVIAGIIAVLVGNIIKLSGLSTEESKMLFYSMELPLDYKGLLFAGILIGALGAVMDVAMSIASSIYEIKNVHPELDFRSLFKSGINVGQDIMGTMSNTLILAYTGSSLPLLLLLSYGNMPFLKAMNLEIISEEILRAFAGSIGLILSIPATAFISALLLSNKKNR